MIETPTLSELIQTLEAEIASRTGDTQALVPGTLPWALARVLAGSVSTMAEYLARLEREALPLTAEGDWLDAWAQMYGLERKAASRARGIIFATGETGAKVDSGGLLYGQYLGTMRWRVTMPVEIPAQAANVMIPVEAADAGSAGDLASGTVLSWLALPAGFDPTAVVGGKDGIYGGSGYVWVSGLEGSELPAGSELQRADQTVLTTSLPVTWYADGDMPAVVQAPQGVTIPAGERLTLTDPPQGVQATAIVMGDGIYGGADAESDLSLRARLLSRLRVPPSATLSDYVRWAAECPGVEVMRAWAWAYPERPIGEVLIQVAMQRDNWIPYDAELSAILAYLAERAPAGVSVTVGRPTSVGVSVGISGLQVQPGYALSAVKAGIQASLRQMLHSQEVRAAQWTLSNGTILQAIATVPGVRGYNLHDVNGQPPSSDVTIGAYSLPLYQGVVWYP